MWKSLIYNNAYFILHSRVDQSVGDTILNKHLVDIEIPVIISVRFTIYNLLWNFSHNSLEF